MGDHDRTIRHYELERDSLYGMYGRNMYEVPGWVRSEVGLLNYKIKKLKQEKGYSNG